MIRRASVYSAPVDILEAFRRNSRCHWKINSLMNPGERIIYEQQNLEQRKRFRCLDWAIKVLESHPEFRRPDDRSLFLWGGSMHWDGDLEPRWRLPITILLEYCRRGSYSGFRNRYGYDVSARIGVGIGILLLELPKVLHTRLGEGRQHAR